MKKIHRVLPILIFPFLISSAPLQSRDVYESVYRGFKINNLTKIENKATYYSLDITNTGNYVIGNNVYLYTMVDDVVIKDDKEVEETFDITLRPINDKNSILVPGETKEIIFKIEKIPYNGFEFSLEDINDPHMRIFDFDVYSKENYSYSINRTYDSYLEKTNFTFHYYLDHQVIMEAYSISFTLDNTYKIVSSYLPSIVYDENTREKNTLTVNFELDGCVLTSELKNIETTLFYLYINENEESSLNENDKIALIISGLSLGIAFIFALTIIGLAIASLVRKNRKKREEK